MKNCDHSWEVESTDYVPPNYTREQALIENDVNAGQVLRQSIEGVTHVYQRCTLCGLLKEDDFYGKYVPPKKK